MPNDQRQSRLPPPPFTSPVVDGRGMMTPHWAAFFRGLYNGAVGSITSSSLTKEEVEQSKQLEQSSQDIASQLLRLSQAVSGLEASVGDLDEGREL